MKWGIMTRGLQWAVTAVSLIHRPVLCDHSDSGDNLDWLRESVPGEPGVDYPIFAKVPETSFSCQGRIFGGFYADPEAECQGYHVCMPLFGGNVDRKMSFLCPNGTIFNQELFVCDWWMNVDCSQAESFYSKNEQIGKEGESAVETNSLDRQSGSQSRPSNGASRPQSAPSSSRPQTNSNSRRPSQRKQQSKKAQPKKQQKKRPSTGGKRRPSSSSSGGGPKRRPSTQGRRKPSSGVTAQPPPPPPQGLFVEYDVTLEDGGGGEDYDGGFPVLLAGTAVDSQSPKTTKAATAPLPSYGARG